MEEKKNIQKKRGGKVLGKTTTKKIVDEVNEFLNLSNKK